MPRLVLATRNAHKTGELKRLLAGSPVELLTMADFPGTPETVEDRPTIEGNAEKKAREAAAATGEWSLADDTGLEVAALDGAPGVYSARYAGPGCTYDDNNKKLLAALEGKKDRSALFRTVIALAHPDGRLALAEGRLPGTIGREARGTNGFGYDPVFVLRDGRALAELSSEEKNTLSHRAQALRAALPNIKKLVLGALCALVLAAPAFAGRTEPGQETIWDQIMAAQAGRDLRMGARALEERRFDLALKEFSRAVAANPNDPTARMMLGVAQYWTGDVEASIESYKKSLAIDPGASQAYMLLGISLAWKGDVKGAYEQFKKAAELDPARPDIQMNMGSIEESLGMTGEALFHFRKAASLSPREPLYRFQLGMLYRKLGRDADAGEELREALKLYPAFEDALLELGAVDERRSDFKAAIHAFKKAVSLKSRDAVARFRLARLYLMTKEVKKAREILREAFHLTPEEGGDGLRLSISYASGKRHGPADAPSKPNAGKGKGKNQPQPEAPKAKPEPSPGDGPLDVFGRTLERIPLDQNAIMQVDVVFAPRPKLVKANPESPSSLKHALEKQRQANASAPKAVRREYPIRAGDAAAREKEIAKVLEDLKGTLAGAPPDTDVRLGMNLTYQRLVDAAPRPLDGKDQPKVSYQPRQVGNDLGLWIIGTGWMALVEEVLPDQAEGGPFPDTSDWHVAMGLGYATLGEGQKALESFEHAVRQDPKNELAHVGRGVASVMTGADAVAIEAFQEALRLNPKNRPAADGLKWLQRPSATRKPT